MSAYETALKHAQNHPSIEFVQVITRPYPKSGIDVKAYSGQWAVTNNIVVAPRIHGLEGVFAADMLQTLLLSLIPDGLKTACMDDFNEVGSRLRFGKLYFDEPIGTVRHTRELKWRIELTGPETQTHTDQGREVVEKDESEKLIMQRTWISLFPTLKIARDFVEDPNYLYMHEIPFSVLAEYRGVSPEMKAVG